MSERNVRLDILRIMSTMLVMITHITFGGTYIDPLKYHSVWSLYMYLDLISHIAVPLFVMISGALLLNKKEFTIKMAIKKSFKFLILYFITAILYSIYTNIIVNHKSFNDIMLCIFKGEYHLWFLPMIIGLYLMTPVMKQLTKKSSRKLLVYIIILWISLNSMSTLSMFFTNKDNWITVAVGFTNYFKIPIVSNYVGYYILGYLLININIKKITSFIFLLVNIASLMLAIYLTNKISYNKEINKYIFMNEMNPLIILATISMFIFVTSLKFRIQNRVVLTIIFWTSKSSLYAYLIHVLFLKIFTKYNKPLMLYDKVNDSYNLSYSIKMIPKTLACVFLSSIIFGLIIYFIIYIFKLTLNRIRNNNKFIA